MLLEPSYGKIQMKFLVNPIFHICNRKTESNVSYSLITMGELQLGPRVVSLSFHLIFPTPSSPLFLLGPHLLMLKEREGEGKGKKRSKEEKEGGGKESRMKAEKNEGR